MLNLKGYILSFTTYLILTIYVLIESEPAAFLKILQSIDLRYLAALPVLMYLGTFSFIFPFKTHARIKGKPISTIQSMKWCIKWTYKNILGQDGNKPIEDFTNDKKTFARLRTFDYLAIMIIATLTIPFLKNPFFPITYLLTIAVGITLFLKEKLYKRNFLPYLFASLLKYPIEMIVPFALLNAFNFSMSIPFLFFFTATTCLLYYIPGFKLAGGLLTLYLMLMSLSSGQGLLLGFITATTLRLCSVTCFILPIFIWRYFYAWHRKAIN